MDNQEANLLSITPSSGNVFADLGLSNAQRHLAKVELAHQINRAVAAKDLKKPALAALFGISEASITALSCGHLDLFSTEVLTYFLHKLNRKVKRNSPTRSVSSARRLSVAVA